jgi:hypothetical protein
LWKTSVRGAFSELVAIVLEEGEGERDLQREREREKKRKKKKKKIIRSVFHSAKNAIFRVLQNVCGRFHILSCVFIFPFLKSRAIMGSKQDHGGSERKFVLGSFKSKRSRTFQVVREAFSLA